MDVQRQYTTGIASGEQRNLDFIHRFAPAEQQAGAPALLLLHGTGGNEESLLPLARVLAPGAALLSPRGKVLERGMPRFFRRLAEGVFDLDDLIVRTHELAGFVTAAAAAYGIDPERMVAIGYSNGANIAASLLLLHPEILAGAVLFRPMVPLEPASQPDLQGKSIFVAAGQYDPIVPAAQSEHLATLLRQAGATVTMHWQEGDHSIERAEIVLAKSWIEEHF